MKEPWGTMLISCAVVLLLSSCNNEYTAKPKAYPRVVFPAHQYELYTPANCPFQFEIPVYANVTKDTVYFDTKLKQPCWLDVNFPAFNGTVNLTYKEIGKENSFERLVEDAHKLSYKHTRKADYINEIRVENAHGVSGLVYDVGGDAASNVQFFLTDSTKHFLRGALYFYNEPNTDSMAPVISFVKEDLRYLLKTFEWK